MPIIESCICTL